MEPSEAPVDEAEVDERTPPGSTDVDVLIVGPGITGIYADERAAMIGGTLGGLLGFGAPVPVS
jgi:hypothetical protein